jgi:ankyrin repeat protein
MIVFKSVGYTVGFVYGLVIIGAMVWGPYILISESLHPSPASLDYQLDNAVMAGDAPKVETLLNRGADVNAKNATDYQSELPLTLAVRDGHLDVARVLLDHGANPNGSHSIFSERTGSDEETDLGMASEKNDVEMIHLLLSHGANIEERGDGPNDTFPLVLAAEDRNVDAVQALLEGGASCGYANSYGGSIYTIAHSTDSDNTPEKVSHQKEILQLLKQKCAR